MKRSSAVLLSVVCAVPCSCDGSLTDPQSAGFRPEAQLTVQPSRQFAFSDYVPLIPGLYGVRTYLTNGGPITSWISGPETVAYDPPISGIKAMMGQDYWVLASHEKKVWWLQFDGRLFSRSCGEFTAYPESAIIGYLYDGMILDMTGGKELWRVDATDPSQCMPVNTGVGDSFVFLIQVQDVRLPDRHVLDHWPQQNGAFKWQTYRNAILMWELECAYPFNLDAPELEEVLGIESPTASNTNGCAIDDLLIWGKNIGLLFQGDVLLATGELEVETYLQSQGPWPRQ